MFNFFKKDPPKQPPPPPAQGKKQAPPPAHQHGTNASPASPQQQPLRTANARYQDPLIKDGVTGVFAPSSHNFNNNSPGNAAAASSAVASSGSGAPRVERLDVENGDFYTGEVIYTLPPEVLKQQQEAALRGSNRASVILSGNQSAAKPTPHGLGELMSDHGRQTFTGYFVQGARDGLGQLVTAKFMMWGFWKNNTVDVSSSVRLDSLESLVKYRGFVRTVPNDPQLKTELAQLQQQMYGSVAKAPPLSQFSLYVATTRFVREGWGEAVYPDGRHVFGRWENDDMFGFGTQVSPDGERYCGMFHQSKFHGYGVLFLPNGAVCEGDWAHGVFKNANGALTIPNRCVMSGQFTDRTTFSRVNIQLLESGHGSSSHSRDDIEVGLSYIARTQYNSLFFWATNAAVIKEEAMLHAVPLLGLLEKQKDPQTAARVMETEVRQRLLKTKRFDNAVRIGQRVVFLQWGSCGSSGNYRSGNGRAALGIMPTRASSSLDARPGNSSSSSKSKANFGSARGGGSSSSHADPLGSTTNSFLSSSVAGLSTNAGSKPLPPNCALGWCETQRSGGCIHTGTGQPITPQTARALFEDMLSFATSCRKYWGTLFETAADIRRTNSGKQQQSMNGDGDGYDDDDDDGMLTRSELLNIISRAAFDAIFGACRKLAINVFCHAFYNEQVAAEAALERLRDVTLNDVGIDFARESDDALFDVYADATRELERSFVSQVPTDILHGLHKWSMSIDSATRDAQAAAGSADDLIPIHQFTLLRAKIPHLVPMTKLVTWMGEQPCFVDPTSAESFCLTTLQACVAMLHDLRSNIRDTGGVLQSPSALEARVDDTLSLLEDQGVPFQLVRRAADYCANMLVLLLGHRQRFLREITGVAQRQQQQQQQSQSQPAAPVPPAALEKKEETEVYRGEDDDDADDEKKKSENDDDDAPTPNKETSSASPSPSPAPMRSEAVFLLPPDALHVVPQQQQQGCHSNKGGAAPAAAASPVVMRLRNSSVIHNTPSPASSPPPATSAAAAESTEDAAAATKSSSSNIPMHGRTRGQSTVSSAPLSKSLDEQMLHAVSMILDASGCQLIIGKVPIAESLRPNRIVVASNLAPANRKNSFGIKQAFGDATPGMNSEGVPTKWCFAVKVPPQLLVSAPQLKIYATKLSFF